jgi:hypothetical protein
MGGFKPPPRMTSSTRLEFLQRSEKHIEKAIVVTKISMSVFIIVLSYNFVTRIIFGIGNETILFATSVFSVFGFISMNALRKKQLKILNNVKAEIVLEM